MTRTAEAAPWEWCGLGWLSNALDSPPDQDEQPPKARFSDGSLASIVDQRKRMMMNIAQRFAASIALAATAASGLATPVEARTYHRHQYYGRTYYRRTAYYRYCRHSSGETGLIAGGVGGALVGSSVIGHGVLGTALGAVGGALAGRAIDRTVTAPRRCYYG